MGIVLFNRKLNPRHFGGIWIKKWINNQNGERMNLLFIVFSEPWAVGFKPPSIALKLRTATTLIWKGLRISFFLWKQFSLSFKNSFRTPSKSKVLHTRGFINGFCMLEWKKFLLIYGKIKGNFFGYLKSCMFHQRINSFLFIPQI